MNFNKKARAYTAIAIGIAALTLSVYIFIGAFMLTDKMEPYMKRPGLYELDKQIELEHDDEARIRLKYKYSNLTEEELTFFDKTLLGLTGGLGVLLALLCLPIGIMLIFKLVKSNPVLGQGIYYDKPFRLNQSDIAEAENPGIYHFHRVDDEFIVISKPKLKKKSLRTFIIWTVISTIAFVAICNSNDYEILGIPTAAALITLYFLLKTLLPSPQLVFDRLNGQLILRGNMVTPGFKASFSRITPAVLYGELLAVSHPLFEYSVLAYGLFNQDTWSFYVHYMDRNRPLPAGDVFDAFREKDYLRRKAVGFSKPLFDASTYICDADYGQVDATPEFRKAWESFKLSIADAHAKALQHIEKDGNRLIEPHKLCFTGIFTDHLVFHYMPAPVYAPLRLYHNINDVQGAYMVHKKTGKVTEG